MPFIKIMGKNDNKKKVKKANVKEFPVDSALEQEKKNLNSKRTAYAIYTVFCFVIVFAAAAAAGYFMANGQKPHISSCGLRIRFVGGNVFDVLPVDQNLCRIFVVRRHFQSASLLRHRGRGVRAHRAWNIHSRDKDSSLQTPCQKGKDYRG